MEVTPKTSPALPDDIRMRRGPDPLLASARRQYVELYAGSVVMTRYLKLALLGVTLVAIGLIVLNLRTQAQAANLRPLVIRIDEVGRAQAVAYGTLTYAPQSTELKYFLIQFTQLHFGRMRATVRDNVGKSLFFLDEGLADATMAAWRKSGEIEAFLTGTQDEVEIHVKNVTLEEIRTAPFRASVDFEKVFFSPGNRAERARETHVAQFQFGVRDQVPNAFIPINPLGLTITYFRTDQAF